MRACEQCGNNFKPQGRQKVCNECKGVADAMQERRKTEAVREDTETAKAPVRPIDKWSTGKVVFQGQSGIIRR